MRSLILLSILLSAAAVSGQNGYSIYGKVVGTDGVPVAGASVSLTDLEDDSRVFSAVTDEKGEFRLRTPPGEYRLEAKLLTNGTITAAVSATVSIRIDMPEIVELRLEPVTGIRETVNISAGVEQTLEEVAKSINVISAQEMRDRADITLVDSLRSVPGLRIQQLGGFGRTASIKTRGLRNQDTAILLDGVRLRDTSAITGDASPFLSDLTLTSVSRVEVLRGSGSSLYGTNAIGGVVDLRTPAPRDGWHGQLSGAFGGLGLRRFRGNVSNRFLDGKFGFNAALARTDHTKGIDGEDDANNTNLQARADFGPTDSTFLSGRIFFSDAYVRLNSSPDTLGVLPPTNSAIVDAEPGVSFVPDANDPDAFQRSRFFNGQIVFTHAVSHDLTLRAHYAGLSTRRRNDNGPLGVGFQSASTSIFEGAIHTANAGIEWTPADIHNVRAGYEFESEDYRNEGLAPTGSSDFFVNASQNSHTLFVQDLIRAYGGRLQVAGGVRAQFFSLRSPGFSLANAPYEQLQLSDPDAAVTVDGAVSYFFRSTGTKLRAHVGNGYRVPSLYERFGTFYSSFGTPSFIALGDPNLKPERSAAVDAGIEQRLFDGKADLSATYFYTHLMDTIGFGNIVPDIGTTNRPFGGYLNQKGGIARGAEFSGSLRPHSSTDVFASYTFTKSLQREPQVTGSGILRTLGVPDHQFTLVATQRIQRFWVNIDVLISSSYLAPIFSNSTFETYVYQFAGNRRADLTAGYTFRQGNDARWGVRLFGTVENLFNNEYYENGFRTAGANGRFGISFSF